MKNLVLLLALLFFFARPSFAQFKGCDCSDAISRDLLDRSSTYNAREVKNWFYKYFSSKEIERKKIKKEKKSSWGLDVIIEGIPIGFNSSDSNSENNSYFKQIEREVIDAGYFSDRHLEIIITQKFSSNQLVAYSKCIDGCIEVNRNGVIMNIGGDVEDVFFLKVDFRNTVGKVDIILAEDIRLANIEPIDGLIFRKDLKIKNFESVTQYFKRVNKDKDASLSLNFIGTSTEPIVIKSSIKRENFVPIGTIVASVLDFHHFCLANNMEEDFAKSSWLPCDGRNIPGESPYKSQGSSTTPDLRGVFLRGKNFMITDNSGAGVPKEGQLSPDPQDAGVFQDDAFQGHGHQRVLGGQINANEAGSGGHKAGNTNWDKESGTITEPVKLGSYGKVRVATETRPNNVTVYYYIKVR